MRTRALFPVTLHTAACGALALVFLGLSVPKVWAAAATWKFGPMLPFHTTNSYLAGLINNRAGSERIMVMLGALPKNEPLAVVYREGNETDIFLWFMVSYFALPRPVRSVPIRRENAGAELEALRKSQLAAIVFCGVDAPPGMENLVTIGDGLVFAVDPARKP